MAALGFYKYVWKRIIDWNYIYIDVFNLEKNLFGRGLSFVIITFNLHCRFILSCIQRMLTYGFLHFLCLEEYEHMFV